MIETVSPLQHGKIDSTIVGPSIVKPLSYPQRAPYDYGSFLLALHKITDGAFNAVPIGAQAIQLIPSLRVIEKLTAPKRGGFYDLKKLCHLQRAFKTAHSRPTATFTPLTGNTDGVLEILPTEYNYEVNIPLSPDEKYEQEIESIMSWIAGIAMKESVRLPDEDIVMVETLMHDIPSINIGTIVAEKLSDNLAADLSNSFYSQGDDTDNSPVSAIVDNFVIKDAKDEEALGIVLDFECGDAELAFGSLELVLAKKLKHKRSKK